MLAPAGLEAWGVQDAHTRGGELGSPWFKPGNLAGNFTTASTVLTVRQIRFLAILAR